MLRMLTATLLLFASNVPTDRPAATVPDFVALEALVPSMGMLSLFTNQQQRRHCTEYYPYPEDVHLWTRCRAIGTSGCRGPEKCKCNSDEHLVSYKCDQGTWHVCEVYPLCQSRYHS
jgi:hypothetical protein